MSGRMHPTDRFGCLESYSALTAETAVNIPVHALASQLKEPWNKVYIRSLSCARDGGGEIPRYVIQFGVVCGLWEEAPDCARDAVINIGASGETQTSTGQPRTAGLRGLVCLPGLTWRIACAVSNLDFRPCCWSASANLFDSDKRFGLLTRVVVRRYHEYESVHAVLRCEAPVLCA
ncbi:hypothetical protein M3J09_004427 [Ascochyta lentis]